MAGNSVKVAVTIPKAVYALMEEVRHKLRISRSAFIDQALEKWLEGQKTERDIRRYQEGYRRLQEHTTDNKAWEKAGLASLTPNEDWL